MMMIMNRNQSDLFLLHVKVVDDNADEQIECEERAKDDEEDEIQIHKYTSFGHRLQSGLQQQQHQFQGRLCQR